MRAILIAAAGLALASLVFAAPTRAADSAPPQRAAIQPLLSTELPDVAGKRLVVVPLKLMPPTGRPNPGHRHPGSVYVYVTQGVARLGVAGQPVQVVHAGESFFEAPGALHNVAESASATEPALAIAVMIVPDGAPLVLPADPHAMH